MTRLPALLNFVFVGALSLLLGWRPLMATLTLAWRDNQYTHVLLILPISATLIYVNRRALGLESGLHPRLGSVLLGLSMLTAISVKLWFAFLTSDAQLAINMLALVIWWIGAFFLCFGGHVSRSFLFALCFLFGLVPIPQGMLNEIVRLMQQGSACVARLLFATAGVPVVQDGPMLTIPNLTVEVAKQCSSIRSSSMLLVTAMVLAQIFLGSPWRKALVIGLAVPLSIAKNGLRIFTIAMLGTRVDSSFLTGKMHHNGGIIFFLVSLVALCLLLLVLRRTEHRLLPSPTRTSLEA
jgi:exosortase